MLCVRPIPQKEKDRLYELLDHPEPQVRKRAKAVLLSSEGYSANEMVLMVNLTAKSIRKWLRRFNEEGVDGLTREREVPWTSGEDHKGATAEDGGVGPHPTSIPG